MSSINIEKILSPVSEQPPTGPDLNGTPLYSEMERLSRGRPEQQMGTSVIPAVAPDWEGVRARCVDLLAKTKDLRVAVNLVVALLQTQKLPGLRDGLVVLKGMVERYWDSMYPKLDPEDRNDPTERINILRVMASRAGGGGDSNLVNMVRETRLTNSRQLGGYGLRDIEIASSNGSPKQGEPGTAAGGKINLALIEASAKDTDRAEMTAAASAATDSAALVRHIESAVDKAVGEGNGVDLKDLARALDAAGLHLHKFLGTAPPSGTRSDGKATDTPQPVTPSVAGEIQSAEDVRRLIDKMCEFYARTEPSSPVPIVLRRAQRLVGKTFWEVLADLSPSAIDAVKTISGTEGPESAS